MHRTRIRWQGTGAWSNGGQAGQWPVRGRRAGFRWREQANVQVKEIPLTWRHVMNAKQDIVFKRCGCTDQDTGRQLAADCPHLAEPGHGS